MRSVFISLLLILIFCAAASAQINEVSLCPKIEIKASFENFEVNKPVAYAANVSGEIGKYNIKYNWTIKGGEILEGQGTETVKINWLVSSNIIVSLEVEGLPKNCSNTASYTTSYIIDRLTPPQARKIDEFSTSASRIAKERIDVLITELKNDPNALIQIIERFSSQTSPKIIERKNHKIIDYLKTKGIERKQFALLNVTSNKNLTEFFIIPAGATLPTCDDCTTIQL